MQQENSINISPGAGALLPLPYHEAVAGYLKEREPEVWAWALSARSRDEHAQAVREELLKQAYRLDAATYPDLHQAAITAAARLGLEVPITLYQGNDGQINASLYFLVGEAHVVFSGPLLDRLTGPEIAAVLGHELAHYKLWSEDGGIYHAADRVLEATAAHPGATPAQLQTSRLFRLFTEAYADRGSVVASGSVEAAVAALVKSATGLSNVSGASYLAQAAEVVAREPAASSQASHPESFLRAHALGLWAGGDAQAESWLDAALRGPLSLDQADWVAQVRLESLTRRALAEMLRPAWMRSDATLAHARRFFPDFGAGDKADDSLAQDLAAAPQCADYISALLIDIAASDRAMEDVAFARVLELGDAWNVGDQLQARMLKDLKMPKRQFSKLRQGARALLDKTEKNHVG
ncbi:M48 family metalloprotease [Polaromonas sp. YR568]|uniref:M48 family metalloprotease n=1 Tax=Polaromonas sp. YR568 TaxID=1855301 RepID=UPI00398BE36C